MDIKWEVIDDDQEVEISKPIEKDHLGTAKKSPERSRVTALSSLIEHNDLFGGAVSESDEEDASQKGQCCRNRADHPRPKRRLLTV